MVVVSNMIASALGSPRNSSLDSSHLGQLCIPNSSDLNVLGCLGSQIGIGRLDGFEHSSNLTGGSVDLAPTTAAQSQSAHILTHNAHCVPIQSRPFALFGCSPLRC